MARTEEE
jgi:hypothetical protein